MSPDVLKLIAAFNELSVEEKDEFAAEIIRRMTLCKPDSLTNTDLTHLANELFLEMDGAEQ